MLKENPNWMYELNDEPLEADVDLRGAGGKEKEIHKMYPYLKRVSAPLYDFIDEETGLRIEVKKTANKKLQAWIDPTKYVDLSYEDRSIIFRFVHFDNKTGKPIEVVDTTLGQIIDRFVPNEILELARKTNELGLKRSQFQFKLNIFYR